MVQNPSRNIPRNHTPELSLVHATKKGDRRLAPLSPYETAGQSTETIIVTCGLCDRNDAQLACVIVLFLVRPDRAACLWP